LKNKQPLSPENDFAPVLAGEPQHGGRVGHAAKAPAVRLNARHARAKRLGAGLGVMAGVAPSAIPVVRAEGRARATWWSLGLEGRFHWPLTTALPGGFELAAGSLTVALVPCGHYRWFRACVDVAIGGLHLEGANVLQARGGWVFHASGGLRIGLMIPFNDTISAGLMAEGQVAFMRTSAVLVTEQGFNRVWTYPLVGGGGTAVLSIRL
jgi:hypothetical protein